VVRRPSPVNLTQVIRFLETFAEGALSREASWYQPSRPEPLTSRRPDALTSERDHPPSSKLPLDEGRPCQPIVAL
jgi:hypothetical protein